MLMPGGKDVLMPPDGAGEIGALVPQAEIVPVPEAAHFVPYQAPERFVAELRRFMAATGS
jgi:pimeloyl-ACP methyl ester carboxylesterase